MKGRGIKAWISGVARIRSRSDEGPPGGEWSYVWVMVSRGGGHCVVNRFLLTSAMYISYFPLERGNNTTICYFLWEKRIENLAVVVNDVNHINWDHHSLKDWRTKQEQNLQFTVFSNSTSSLTFIHSLTTVATLYICVTGSYKDRRMSQWRG